MISGGPDDREEVSSRDGWGQLPGWVETRSIAIKEQESQEKTPRTEGQESFPQTREKRVQRTRKEALGARPVSI